MTFSLRQAELDPPSVLSQAANDLKQLDRQMYLSVAVDVLLGVANVVVGVVPGNQAFLFLGAAITSVGALRAFRSIQKRTKRKPLRRRASDC